MMELFILALAYINIIDATTNGQIHVDGVIDDSNVTVQLFRTYQIFQHLHSHPETGQSCEQVLCIYVVDQTELLTSARSTSDGSFTLSASPKQIDVKLKTGENYIVPGTEPHYSILVNGHEEKITLIHNGLRDHAESYSIGQIDQTDFGTMIGHNILHVTAKYIVIPEWFRNTAGYWAEEKITNADFLNALDYLINKNIIIISTRI